LQGFDTVAAAITRKPWSLGSPNSAILRTARKSSSINYQRGEDKWDLQSDSALLHHGLRARDLSISSARIERFLKLAAKRTCKSAACYRRAIL